MFRKFWNFICALIVTCSISHTTEVDINIGQLRAMYANTNYSRAINVFLSTAPAICKRIIDPDSYQSKKTVKKLLNSVNQLLYVCDLNFGKSYSDNGSSNGKWDIYNETFSSISGKCANKLLFLSLEESDLAEDELWDLAKFQLIHTFINEWYHTSLKLFFNDKNLNFVTSITRTSRDPCVYASLFLKDLFAAEESYDEVGVMMCRVEDSKEKWNVMLVSPPENYAMF